MKMNFKIESVPSGAVVQRGADIDDTSLRLRQLGESRDRHVERTDGVNVHDRLEALGGEPFWRTQNEIKT